MRTPREPEDADRTEPALAVEQTFPEYDAPSSFGKRRVSWHPVVDVIDEGDQVVVLVDLPGVDRKNIDVRFHDGLLTITGERKQSTRTRRGVHQRRERICGTFGRSFAVPGLLEAGRISASLKHGVLTVTLPKKTTSSTRPIRVPVE